MPPARTFLAFERYLLLMTHFFRLIIPSSGFIPTYFLKHDSAKFREELDAPLEPGKKRKGSEGSSAIHFRETTPNEFAKFLWVYYNRCDEFMFQSLRLTVLTVRLHLRKYDQYRATVEEWTSILKIASTSEFRSSHGKFHLPRYHTANFADPHFLRRLYRVWCSH